jgi:4-alpha-glucanotransferase
MHLFRASGILLHPTALPGRFGIGDLGLEAYQFVDFLARSAQRLWQVLPLGPTGLGNSPYMSFSTMAGNPLLISPDLLKDYGLLSTEDLEEVPNFPEDKVDFDQVIPWKTALLQRACKNFMLNARRFQQKEFEGFCRGKARWLDDYALFMALLNAQEEDIWMDWSLELRAHKPDVLEQWRDQLQDEIFFHKFVQYEFFRQWSELKRYANDQNIYIIGDIPIYVASNSADVWGHPEVFKLDPETGHPTEVAGVPPDYFSATGQLWGNPIYDWEYLESTNFAWWVGRIREVLMRVDLFRIDHFRGFESFWSVPAGEKTALNGQWVKAPGYQLFETILEELGSLPILAEDLGIIGPEVIALRDRFGFPGMKILHFAFEGNPKNPYLPFNVGTNSVIYTGTHDNNTTVGWYKQISDQERTYLHQYLGCQGPYGIEWDLIRLALSSSANFAIIPLQDVLGLDTDARMNIPGKAEDNWAWRFRSELLTETYSNRLKEMTLVYGRG